MIWQILGIVAGFICIVASILCLLTFIDIFRDSKRKFLGEEIVCAILFIELLLAGCVLIDKSIEAIQTHKEVVEFYSEDK